MLEFPQVPFSATYRIGQDGAGVTGSTIVEALVVLLSLMLDGSGEREIGGGDVDYVAVAIPK